MHINSLRIGQYVKTVDRGKGEIKHIDKKDGVVYVQVQAQVSKGLVLLGYDPDDLS